MKKGVMLKPTKFQIQMYNSIYSKCKDYNRLIDINKLRMNFHCFSKRNLHLLLSDLQAIGLIEFKKNCNGFGTLCIEVKKTKYLSKDN